MRIVRFQKRTGDIRCGYLLGSTIIDLGDRQPHDILANLPKMLCSERPIYNRSQIKLLPPVDPGKVVRLDGCYEQDVTEQPDPHLGDLASGDRPSLWVSPTGTLAAGDAEVPLPTMAHDVRPGVELGLVVGEQARCLTPEEASKYIAGYTVCRTLRAHDQHPGLYGYRMFPGFLGVGPSVVPEIELPVALGIRKNNETVDRSSTSRLRFSIGDIVSYASRVFTLEPGDLVVTGDPTRSKNSVNPDETVTAWIESIGRQATTFVAEEGG